MKNVKCIRGMDDVHLIVKIIKHIEFLVEKLIVIDDPTSENCKAEIDQLTSELDEYSVCS